MEEINQAVLGFVVQNAISPLPRDTPTRQYMVALRTYLDANLPRWRERAFADAPTESMAIEVEFWLASGREVRGTLAQRPSGVSREKLR